MSSTTKGKRSTKKRSKNPVAAKETACDNVKPLSTSTEEALRDYFASLNGHQPGDLYQLVISEVEKPLFRAVLEYTNGNQSRAAEVLGINRGTLRKKLNQYAITSD